MFRFLTINLCVVFLMAFPAFAQSFTPDVGQFDGASTIALDANDAFDIAGSGTIEFWVEPDWTEDPGYDPVIISNAGADGASYLVAILRDRDGLGVLANERVEFVDFDFTDGKMHFVALCDYEDALLVYIDGELLARFENMSFASLPSQGVWIGSADGETAPFIGAIANLRLWGYPVGIKELLTYAVGDLFENEESRHPGLDFLLGISDFENADFLIATN